MFKETISICILTYNRIECLKRQLIHLTNIDYDNLELIVVDNCSSDNTQQIMENDFNDIVYIRTATNLGAAARNIGIKRASGNIIITLDDDIIGLTKDCILRIVDKFSTSAKLGIINFKIINHINYEICNWVHHCKQELFSEEEFLTYEITEGAVAFRKEIFDKVGYYPDHFFISHEGLDLALRTIDMGYCIIYFPHVTVIHFHSDLGRKSWYNYYYDTRNLFLIAARYFPVSHALAYLSRGLISMFLYSVRDGYCKSCLKAIKDGLVFIRSVKGQRKVLKPETMKFIHEIDKRKPSLFYLIKKRLFAKSARL